jgi:hypothetical protein
MADVDLSDVPFRAAFRRANPPRAGSPVVRLDPSEAGTDDRGRKVYVCKTSDRVIDASDVREGILQIASGLHRVQVKGGTFDAIEFIPPGNSTEVSTDLVFEGCSWRASEDDHMRIYARRIEFIECTSQGDWYACFASDDVPSDGPPTRFKLGDFLFYGCDFRINGGHQACVRLHDIRRLVIKNSIVRSGGNKGLRVHGNSRYLFIRNLRCEDSDHSGSGIHLGTIGGGMILADRANILRVWLRDITSCVTGAEDIAIGDGREAERDRRRRSVRYLIAENVWSYRPADSWSAWETFIPEPWPSTWTITDSGRRIGDCPAA